MSRSLLAAPRPRDAQEATPFHHVVKEEPAIRPIFAADHSTFHPGINRYWQVFERAAAGDGSVSPDMVFNANESLIALLRGRTGERTHDGLARFRREFCLGQLESIAALKGTTGSDVYIKMILTGDGLGSSGAVDSSIRAGVSDLNERYVTSLRKRYSAKSGFGEKLLDHIKDFHDAVINAHPGVGVASARHGEQASNAERLLKQFGEIAREIRTFLLVIPRDRALVMDCNEHVEGIRSRLHTNHFGGVSYLSNILIGDIREGINILRMSFDRPASTTLGTARRASRRA